MSPAYWLLATIVAIELPEAGAAAAVDAAAGAAVEAGAAAVADSAGAAAAVDASAAELALSLLLPELLHADNEKTIADAIAAARIVRVTFILESPRTCRERGLPNVTLGTLALGSRQDVLIA